MLSYNRCLPITVQSETQRAISPSDRTGTLWQSTLLTEACCRSCLSLLLQRPSTYPVEDRPHSVPAFTCWEFGVLARYYSPRFQPIPLHLRYPGTAQFTLSWR